MILVCSQGASPWLAGAHLGPWGPDLQRRGHQGERGPAKQETGGGRGGQGTRLRDEVAIFLKKHQGELFQVVIILFADSLLTLLARWTWGGILTIPRPARSRLKAVSANSVHFYYILPLPSLVLSAVSAKLNEVKLEWHDKHCVTVFKWEIFFKKINSGIFRNIFLVQRGATASLPKLDLIGKTVSTCDTRDDGAVGKYVHQF